MVASPSAVALSTYDAVALTLFVAAGGGRFVELTGQGELGGLSDTITSAGAAVLAAQQAGNGEVSTVIVRTQGQYAFTIGYTLGLRNRGSIGDNARRSNIVATIHSHPDRVGSGFVLSSEDAGLNARFDRNFFVTPGCKIYRISGSGARPWGEC